MPHRSKVRCLVRGGRKQRRRKGRTVAAGSWIPEYLEIVEEKETLKDTKEDDDFGEKDSGYEDWDLCKNFLIIPHSYNNTLNIGN